MSPASEITSQCEPKRTRILPVEDSENLTEEIMFFLCRYGHDIKTVTHIHQALELLQQQKFDILLLDRMLPDGDSLEKLDAFRDRHDGYVIMLTAFNMLEDRLSGFQAGADHYLGKPVRLQELQFIIENLMRRRTSTAVKKPAQSWALDTGCNLLHTPRHHKIHLTGRELQILEKLIASNGEAVKKDLLFQSVCATKAMFTEHESRRLDTSIYRLRKKIQIAEGTEETPLTTLYGIGYAWRT